MQSLIISLQTDLAAYIQHILYFSVVSVDGTMGKTNAFFFKLFAICIYSIFKMYTQVLSHLNAFIF